MVDVDASLVESHSDKQGAAATFKKHIYGLHPIVVSVANTSEVLAVLLRKGNAGSNTVADHVTVPGEAIAQVPAAYRKKIIFRADGAGATKDLLAWIKAEAVEKGYTWHYSVGFDVTESVRTAITQVPADVWVPALTPEGTVRRGAYTTEITGLLELADGWPAGQRTLARTEPLHPKHRKQASEVEKRRGQRFQAVATDLPGNHYPKLDAFHRNHAGVETVIKDAKKPWPETAAVLLPRVQPGLVHRCRDRLRPARLAPATHPRPLPEPDQSHPRHPAQPAAHPRPPDPTRPQTHYPAPRGPSLRGRPHSRLAENSGLPI